MPVLDCYVYSPFLPNLRCLQIKYIFYFFYRPFGKQGLSNVEIFRLPPMRPGFDKLVVDSRVLSSFSKGQDSMFSFFSRPPEKPTFSSSNSNRK